jgi:putative oxidoreductase
MIFAMGVAFFSWHGGGMQEGELSLIYFVVFLMMLVAGPGRYSLDHLISILKEE